MNIKEIMKKVCNVYRLNAAFVNKYFSDATNIDKQVYDNLWIKYYKRLPKKEYIRNHIQILKPKYIEMIFSNKNAKKIFLNLIKEHSNNERLIIKILIVTLLLTELTNNIIKHKDILEFIIRHRITLEDIDIFLAKFIKINYKKYIKFYDALVYEKEYEEAIDALIEDAEIEKSDFYDIYDANAFKNILININIDAFNELDKHVTKDRIFKFIYGLHNVRLSNRLEFINNYKNNISYINIEPTENYYIINKNNLINFIIGYIFGNCQALGDIGHEAALFSATNPYVSNIVYKNKNGNDIATSLLIYDYINHTIILDSIEIKHDNKELIPDVATAINNFVNNMITKYGINKIAIGKQFIPDELDELLINTFGKNMNISNVKQIEWGYATHNGTIFQYLKKYHEDVYGSFYSDANCNMVITANENKINKIKNILNSKTIVITNENFFKTLTHRISEIEKMVFPSDMWAFDKEYTAQVENFECCIYNHNWYMILETIMIDNKKMLYVNDFSKHPDYNITFGDMKTIIKTIKNLIYKDNFDGFTAEFRESTSYRFKPLISKMLTLVHEEYSHSDDNSEPYYTLVFMKKEY